jgi:hypothetical protein
MAGVTVDVSLPLMVNRAAKRFSRAAARGDGDESDGFWTKKK